MTKEQLRQAIQDFVGLTVQDDPESDRKFIVRSPSGLVVTELTVFCPSEAEGWQFGGMSMAFNDSWKVLCRIHESGK